MPRYNAHGTQLRIGDGGDPEAFTTVAQVRDITGPGLSTNIITASDHDSMGVVTKLPGLKDGGQVTFDVNLDSAHATHDETTGLYGAFVARTDKNWEVVFTDGTTWAFSGIVQAFSPNAPVDDALTASITIEVTSIPTLS